MNSNGHAPRPQQAPFPSTHIHSSPPLPLPLPPPTPFPPTPFRPSVRLPFRLLRHFFGPSLFLCLSPRSSRTHLPGRYRRTANLSTRLEAAHRKPAPPPKRAQGLRAPLQSLLGEVIYNRAMTQLKAKDAALSTAVKVVRKLVMALPAIHLLVCTCSHFARLCARVSLSLSRVCSLLHFFARARARARA